ncbi:hypothetical protein DOTSEDRAFT_176333 [Dothistroma septosporum NZE10]|uniref:Xaa-Pro dipeptidyl-peptidase C-terminal domain-containing protein n=1 Tax=Dothistroma septosporum (strain NZE10 / CBS 128990) TaxID=675120 RepID=N1PF98_DOTSN|nr:hypothetical protein DOTSEDRAFT_176333 [Dothistroma septosporum NZE10]
MPTPPTGRPGDHYAGFVPGTTTLPAGHRKRPQCRPLATDTICDRDIPISTRDGAILRADVFRPITSSFAHPVPALLVWSPYGKSGAGLLGLSFMPARAGIPESALSGYEKFEGPDPAEWVPRGYAVVNIDARGVFDSEGDVRVLGAGEGEDGADAVEHIASLPWCSGAVALIGNSWLAMATYHIAAQQPKGLKCVAPLEGASDFYRETLCRGGVPQPGFWYAVAAGFSGRGKTEDPAQVAGMHPDWNEYWEDKRVDFEKIRVPAYVLASFSTGLHTEGSVRCYEELRTAKWLTFHDTQEWYDLYSSKRNEELAAFFEHFLKGVDNGFEKTPKVRAALLGYNEPNLTDVDLEDWPAPQTEYTKLFLSQNGSLADSSPREAGTISYQSDIQSEQKDADGEEILFTHTFTKRSHLLGYSKASLYVSCPDHDDLDIFLQIRKADKNGAMLRSQNIPLSVLKMSQDQVPPLNILQYLGPTGICRASRRDLDEKLSKPYYPVPSLGKTEKIQPGDVVKLDIGIWPGGMIFEAGEKLVLKISGHPMTLAEFPQLWGSHKTENKGRHVVHFGGGTPSYVQVPFVEL